MADSAFKTQVSRDENANSASNVLFIQIADDAGNVADITGGALDVNGTFVPDTSYVDDGAFVIGTDKVNAQGFLADETATDSVDEGDIGLARMTLTRIQLATIDDGAGNRLTIDGSGFITSNINGTVTVSATDLDIRDLTHVSDSVSIGDGTTLADVLDGTIDALYVAITDGTEALAINADGSINVAVVPTAGTKVHDYKTATPGAGASDNHDYTVAGTTFELSRVQWGGSGKIKVEVQYGPIASLATVAVGFSEKDGKDYIEFNPVLEVPATGTGTVRVIVTNRQGAAVDVYSTIMGVDVA
jgi:hypothetical protein